MWTGHCLELRRKFGATDTNQRVTHIKMESTVMRLHFLGRVCNYRRVEDWKWSPAALQHFKVRRKRGNEQRSLRLRVKGWRERIREVRYPKIQGNKMLQEDSRAVAAGYLPMMRSWDSSWAFCKVEVTFDLKKSSFFGVIGVYTWWEKEWGLSVWHRDLNTCVYHLCILCQVNSEIAPNIPSSIYTLV